VINSLQELLADHQMYHSDFQMDYFITARAGGTVYGQYKQALRELFKRYRGLKELYVAKKLLEVDIAELSEWRLFKGKFERARCKINLAEKKMGMEDLDRNICDTEREFEHFYGQAQVLKKEIGDLTIERRAELDRDMWEHRLKSMAAVDYLTQGRIGENTITFIQSAPPAWRHPILKSILGDEAQRAKLLNWFLQYDGSVCLPQIPNEINIDVKKLVGS